MKDPYAFKYTARDIADLMITVAGSYNQSRLGDLSLTIEGFLSVNGEDVFDEELPMERKTGILADIILKHGSFEGSISHAPEGDGERAMYFVECMVSRFGKGVDGPILSGLMPDGSRVHLDEDDGYASFKLEYTEGGEKKEFILDYTIGGPGGCSGELLHLTRILTKLLRNGLVVDESWPLEMKARGHDIRT